jgi:hypothetical protein
MTSNDTGGKLSELEAAVLLTATDKGVIKIPNGTAMEIDECRSLLARLQKRGLVRRHKDAPFYGQFQLTSAGRAMIPETPALPEKKYE